MDFKSFVELREFIRGYNSTSILKVGTSKCWQKWGTKHSDFLNRQRENVVRNYAVRLMLLASAGNPHRDRDISIKDFDILIDAYHSWKEHTISDESILDEEARIILSSIQIWESEHEREVRNWSFKLSDILNFDIIRKHVVGMFIQRVGAFQGGGFGSPISRIKRTIKFIELLDSHSNEKFSCDFFGHTKLTPQDYFRQFIGCLALFERHSERKGFCDLSQLPSKDPQVAGITPESLKVFIGQNSALFSAQTNDSFRSKLNQAFNDIPDFYQPFFYNQFLETPFIELDNDEFCLPDPFSFTESAWNQVRSHVLENSNGRKLISSSFEAYLGDVLFPSLSPNSFEKISEVKNPASSKDKRADFLIEVPNSYIILEAKISIMSADTSAYFTPNKLADLWCRIHCASEQISATVEALSLRNKPVIPLVITYYDSIYASAVFEEMARQTDYCSRLGLNMAPIVHSLHEFEHLISNRSINNWVESILSKQNESPRVQPDYQGHNYQHLNAISII